MPTEFSFDDGAAREGQRRGLKGANAMYLQIMCSSCGHRSRKFKYDKYRRTEPADEIVSAGWNSYGDAFYCQKCVKTWERRNGKDRPLWGKAHTRERVYQVMIGDLMDENEYLRKGEWPC